MRVSSLIAATLGLILNYGGAVAQPASPSADYWMPGCRYAAALIYFSNEEDSKEDLVKIGFCVGVISGLSYTGVSSGLCAPEGATSEQAVRAVVQYIDGQPTRMNDDLRRLVLEALQTAWPCKK
jgi:hypothetical protein